MLCRVYRSPKVAEMYLYVNYSEDLEKVPAPLLQRFGEPEQVMILKLEEARSLARVDAAQVRESLRDQGYFLQMPPARPGAVDRD